MQAQMLYRHLPLAIAMAALAIGVSPAPAQPRADTLLLSAATKKATADRRVSKKRRPTHQVACTIYGCQPVPRRCHPQQGYDWDGIPTGFDVVVCR
jgi:hypothetical protein